jgi:hypothetical protein
MSKNEQKSIRELPGVANFKLKAKAMNMRILVVFVILIICCFTGCDDNEKKEGLVFIETADIYSEPTSSGYFAFLHDKDGNFIDAIEIFPDGSFELSGPATNELLKVTVLRHFVSHTGPHVFFLASYDVTPGTRWSVRNPEGYPVPVPETIGYAEVEIKNFPEVENHEGALGISTSSGINVGIINRRYEGSSYKFSMSVKTNDDSLLLTAYRDGLPVYVIETGIGDNDIVVSDFNDYAEQVGIVAPDLSGSTFAFVNGYRNSRPTVQYSLTTYQLQATGNGNFFATAGLRSGL